MTEIREQFLDTEFEPPLGPIETTVAEVMADILGVNRLGRADSFYDFGGTSLHAIRICARIEKQTGYRALPIWLMTNDVLADFTARLFDANEKLPDV